MKARARKSGGAYRNYKQKMTCHAKPGKDRRKARGQVKQQRVEYKGYTAIQSADNNYITIFNNRSGNIVAHFPQNIKQTAEQLQGHIDFYINMVKYCTADAAAVYYQEGAK